MANMTFKTNLLPNSTTQEYSLGSSTNKWKIYGDLIGNAEKVTQNNQTGAAEYRILLSGSANNTNEFNITNKSGNLTFNPSTKLLSIGGGITATGDLTITGNSTLSGETSIISLTTGSLLVNGNANFAQIPTAPTPATSSNDTSIATTAFVKNNLGGLSGAMHFKGTTTTTMSDGLTTAAVTIGGTSYTPSAGDVVLYSDSEFVWTGSVWERLGRDSSFKTTQSAVTTATAETTTATTFVYSVTQDANGVITVKTRPLPTYNNYSLPTASTSIKGGIKVGSGLTMSSETLNHTNSVTAKISYGSTATTASANGGTIIVTDIRYDAQGHITASTDRTITLSQTTYEAEKGISLSSGKFGHSNTSITAKTAAAQAAKTLTWGGTFTLYEEKYDTYGHITGVASYNMIMPSNPNTDTKQNITLATTSKAYITGVTTTPTASATAMTGVADTDVYLTTTAGQLNAKTYLVDTHVILQYDSALQALEFAFI